MPPEFLNADDDTFYSTATGSDLMAADIESRFTVLF